MVLLKVAVNADGSRNTVGPNLDINIQKHDPIEYCKKLVSLRLGNNDYRTSRRGSIGHWPRDLKRQTEK